jgi:hypothetical protein
MDVPERLPPRPLRYRGRGFGAKAPLRKPKFISAFLPQAWLPPRPFASSRTRGSRLPGPLPSRPLCHRRRVFGAKAPPTEAHFCRSGFSRDLLRHREPGVRGCRGSSRRDPCVIEDGCSGLKPLLQKPSFCRSGFSRDLFASSKTMGLGSSEQPSPQPFRHRSRKFGAKAPPTGRSMLGRSGFSRDLASSRTQRFEVLRTASAVTLASSKTEVRG